MTKRYLILADDPHGQIILFTWVGSAEAGVRRAKFEAKVFGRDNLTNFVAKRIR